MFIKLEIKPLSVNKAWQGRRYKTDEYKLYEENVMFMLRRIKLLDIDFLKPLKIEIVAGMSVSADIDNVVKPFLDILQKRFNFNDKNIMELFLKKEITPKKYIKFKISNL